MPNEPTPSVYVKEMYIASVSVANSGGLPLTFDWKASRGELVPSDSTVEYTAPDSEGTDTITLTVKSKGGTIASKTLTVKVIEPPPPYDISRDYIPSGWMGDGALANANDYIQMGQVVIDGRTCFNISYKPGPNGWGGVYFQFPPDNWGEQKGKDLRRYTKVKFEAKAEGEAIVEFKAGGIKNPGKPYQDSFEVTLGTVRLENVWKSYIIPLEGEDLSNVIGAFAWIATKAANPNGATFYIARPINYEFSCKEDTSKLTISDIKLERHNKQTTNLIQTSPEKAKKLPAGFTEKLYSVKWIAYSPTNWDPEKKIYPPEESIRADLLVLRKYFNGIVTYAADDTISRLSKELGFSILYGIWSPNSEQELTKAKEASTNDAVLGYICGNEGLGTRYDLATLERVIEELSEATGKPVTTTEELHDYYNPRVLELGGFCTTPRKGALRKSIGRGNS